MEGFDDKKGRRIFFCVHRTQFGDEVVEKTLGSVEHTNGHQPAAAVQVLIDHGKIIGPCQLPEPSHVRFDRRIQHDQA